MDLALKEDGEVMKFEIFQIHNDWNDERSVATEAQPGNKKPVNKKFNRPQ